MEEHEANQPVVNGQLQEPMMLNWGEVDAALGDVRYRA
jgi:hypothetical protein